MGISMVKILMLLFLIPVMAMGETTLGHGKDLDAILLKTGKIRKEGVKGFVLHHGANETVQMPQIPPITKTDTAGTGNFTKSIEIAVPVGAKPDTGKKSVPVPVYGRFVPYQSYLNDLTALNDKINALQVDYAATSAKMAMILDNVAENSGTQKDSLEMLTKFMEAFSALFAAIGGAVALWQIFKKKKKQA
jgi:hypothetical protein